MQTALRNGHNFSKLILCISEVIMMYSSLSTFTVVVLGFSQTAYNVVEGQLQEVCIIINNETILEPGVDIDVSVSIISTATSKLPWILRIASSVKCLPVFISLVFHTHQLHCAISLLS